MGWEARKNAGGAPRGNTPSSTLPKSSAHFLVQGCTVVRWRRPKHAHEVVAPWAEDDDPARLSEA